MGAASPTDYDLPVRPPGCYHGLADRTIPNSIRDVWAGQQSYFNSSGGGPGMHSADVPHGGWPQRRRLRVSPTNALLSFVGDKEARPQTAVHALSPTPTLRYACPTRVSPKDGNDSVTPPLTGGQWRGLPGRRGFHACRRRNGTPRNIVSQTAPGGSQGQASPELLSRRNGIFVLGQPVITDINGLGPRAAARIRAFGTFYSGSNVRSRSPRSTAYISRAQVRTKSFNQWTSSRRISRAMAAWTRATASSLDLSAGPVVGVRPNAG